MCIWHAIIGSITYIENRSQTTVSDDRNSWIDRGVFFMFLSLYILMHMIMLIWLHQVPLARRRKMKQEDIEYRKSLCKQSNGVQSVRDTYVLDVLDKNNKKRNYVVSSMEVR